MSTIADVSYDTALDLLADGAYLLDVRTDDEWNQGHSPRAHHLELSFIPDSFDTLPDDVLIVCVCRSGARSRRAAEFLAERGFDTVNAEGGMIAWAEAGCELVGDSDEPLIS
jgi:rhodanese-related sulfurtransferase